MLLNHADHSTRISYKKKELELLFYKTLLQLGTPHRETKVASAVKLFGKRKKTWRNVCIVTGRARGVYTKFSVSRFQIRALSQSGSIAGLQKLAW